MASTQRHLIHGRRELRTLVEHMILSHHGQLEFGSPKLPQFPEALLLHYLDDLDSKMEAMRAQFERDSTLDGPWTSYNASLGRPLLSTEKFLAPKKPAAEEGTEEPVSDHHESRSESKEPASTLPGLVPQR